MPRVSLLAVLPDPPAHQQATNGALPAQPGTYGRMQLQARVRRHLLAGVCLLP